MLNSGSPLYGALSPSVETIAFAPYFFSTKLIISLREIVPLEQPFIAPVKSVEVRYAINFPASFESYL